MKYWFATREWTTYVVLNCLLQLSSSLKSNYVIVGVPVGTSASFLSGFRPTFEDYLNAEVGRQFNPPISFTLKVLVTSKHSGSLCILTRSHLNIEFTVCRFRQRFYHGWERRGRFCLCLAKFDVVLPKWVRHRSDFNSSKFSPRNWAK